MNAPSSGPEGVDGNIHTNWLGLETADPRAGGPDTVPDSRGKEGPDTKFNFKYYYKQNSREKEGPTRGARSPRPDPRKLERIVERLDVSSDGHLSVAEVPGAGFGKLLRTRPLSIHPLLPS